MIHQLSVLNQNLYQNKKQGPKTLSLLLYRRPGSNRHVLADTGFWGLILWYS